MRISGPAALDIATRLTGHNSPFEPRSATLTSVRSRGGDLIDRAIVTFFKSPHSYTGDDVVEISAHGSPVVLTSIVEHALSLGARYPGRGEFTLRAFLNGRIDLVQAEAVADLIDASTPLQARAAFDQLNGTLTEAIDAIGQGLFDLIARLEASVDFPDEGYHFIEPEGVARAIDAVASQAANLLTQARRGRMIREGLRVAIVGRPNVGKSSLFNALVGAGRAIVHEEPGTTRDLVTEVVDVEGLKVTLIDTAGIREATEPVEREGVARSQQAANAADLVLRVFAEPDQLGGQDASQTIDKKELTVVNKSDISRSHFSGEVVRVSALTGLGLDVLRRRIVESVNVAIGEPTLMTNQRHIGLVERAHESLQRARAAALSAGGPMSEEFVLADLQEARQALDEVAGRRTNDDVLTHIFTRFCIGK